MPRFYPISEEGRAQKEYGIDANIIKTKRFALTAARDLVSYEFGGSALWAMNASSIGAWIDIRLNDQLRDPVRYQQGLFIGGTPYSRLFVSNDAQAGEWIDVLYVREARTDQIKIINPASQFNVIDLTKAGVINTVADVPVNAATVQVLAANAARRAAFISNLAANPNVVRVGDAATAVAQGFELAVGATGVTSTTGGIYVFSAGASNIGLTWTED